MPFLKKALILGFGWALVLARPVHAACDPSDKFSDTFSASITFFKQLFHDEPPRVVRDHIVSISPQASSLTFEYEDGGTLRISLHDGQLQIDDRIVGRFPQGGALELSWRQFVLEAARTGTAEVLTLARNWQPDGLSREEDGLVSLMQERLATLSERRAW